MYLIVFILAFLAFMSFASDNSKGGFDGYNRKEMQDFKRSGEIPEKKSLNKALVLVLLFGGLGLVYSAPKSAIPLGLIEYVLLLFSFGFLAIVTRPILLVFAYFATESYNRAGERMFGSRFGGDAM
jgi:hypothetical protein